MTRNPNLGRTVGLAVTVIAVVACGLGPATASAGDWMQVSCVNPNGSAAPSEGWASLSTNTPEPGSNSTTACGPGSPMSAYLSSQAPAYVTTAGIGTSEDLQYTPPGGSELVGGYLDVNAYGDGYGTAGGAPTGSGDALMFTPDFAFGGVNVFFQCAWTLTTNCSPGAADPAAYSGVVAVPAGRGGTFTVAAACGGNPSTGLCDQNAGGGAWASMQVLSSNFLLANGSAPAASGLGGSLLSPGAFGTADVSFTATDTGGPGVYNVTAQIDGQTVYDATPNTESGRCASVGNDAADHALMFDYQQPCPVSAPVLIPVDTTALKNGEHQLTVTVTDAAQNASTVIDQTIITEQPGAGTVSTPPPPAHHVRARLLIRSRYAGTRTRLIQIEARDLPRDAHVVVACDGRRCPRPTVEAASARHVRRLWMRLARKVFRAGDRLIFTITAPGLLPERNELIIRAEAKPVAKQL